MCMHVPEQPFGTITRSKHEEQLRPFLENGKRPLMEASILKELCPDLDFLSLTSTDMYKIHFELFHLLFTLQDYYLLENKYLHVHFMRTFLLPYPRDYHCRHYYDDAGAFCERKAPSPSGMCDYHQKLRGENELSELSDKYFYLDLRNYTGFDASKFESVLDGSREIIQNYQEYREGLEILNLSEQDSLETIKRNFRKTAKLYHPDNGGESEEIFKKINNSYHLLLKVKGH